MKKTPQRTNLFKKDFPESSFFDVNYARFAADKVQKVLETGYCGGTSPFILQAESILENKFGRPVKLVSNGTIALEAALRLSGVRQGDRVAVAARSFVATANAVLSVGAIPVFIGLDSQGLGICANTLDIALIKNQDIRIVIAAHLYGYAPTLADLANVCHKHNCILLEDSAQGFDESFNGRPLGTWGKFGTFSFFSNKVLACGEGGAVVCETSKDAKRLDEMRYHGGEIGQDGEFHPNAYGSNWRMNGLSAAVLCSSLENISETMEARRLIAEKYVKKFSTQFHLAHTLSGASLSRWCIVVLDQQGQAWEAKKAKEMALSLRRKGVAARTGMPWLPNLPHLDGFDCIGVAPIEQRCLEVLLPCHQGMNEESVMRVISAFIETINTVQGDKNVGL